MYVKRLIISKDKHVRPLIDLHRSIHLSDGTLRREDLVAADHRGIVPTTTGEPKLLAPATFKDSYDKMKRTAATIIPKDIGFIIAETGLTKDAVVIDAGGGSGAVTTQLAALCKRVYSYDINENHLNTIAENCKRLDLDNVIIKPEDLITAQPPEKVDLLVLDMPDPSKALTFAKRALKQSGFVVAYTPHITQAQLFADSLDQDFKLVTTIELMQRRWEVSDGKLRPKHNMLGHTAFLTFARLFKWLR
ncbi:MAG: tRNA (adenine-N1)-methyltransferase [Candidatus Woesearchaeota archaeon]